MPGKMHIFDYTRLFEGVTVDQRQRLMLAETICHCQKGDCIFKAGDKAREIFCLAGGKVKLSMEGMDRVQIVRLVRKDECFGYPPCFADGRHRLTATAMTDVTLVKVPMREVKWIIAENGRVGLNFARELAMRLGAIDERLVNLTQKHVRGRMAEALMLMAEAYGRDEETGVMGCAMTREEIASFANMTTANAIRTLAAFRDEGVIAFEGRRLRVIDEGRLAKISDMG